MTTLWQSISTEKTLSASTPSCAQIQGRQGFAYDLATVIPCHALPKSAMKRVNLEEGGGG